MNTEPGEPDTAGNKDLPPEAADWTAALHSSLQLEEILRACRRLLGKPFDLQRLSLVQRRANDAVALYALDEYEDAPLLGPKIISLAPSRLKGYFDAAQGLLVASATDSEPDCVEREYLTGPTTVSFIYSPLLLKTKLKAVLVLGSAQAGPLKATDTAFLASVSDHLALALENSDTHYLVRRRGRQLAMVSEIAKQAVMLEDLREFLQAASDLLRQGFDYDIVQVWTVGLRQELFLRGYAYKSRPQAIIGQTRPLIIEECRRQNQILCNNNIIVVPMTEPGHERIASQLVVPIRLRGKFLGVLFLESERLDAFSPEDFNIMEGVASLFASAFDNLHQLTYAKQSNQYMQAILESAKDMAILSTDIHGYVLTGSAGCKPIFQLSQQEITGKDILTLFSDTRFQKELTRFLAGSVSTTLERNKLSQKTADASSFLDVSVERVYDAEKRPIGFMCIARDVSESALLQQKLEGLSMTDELTGLFNQRRFFASVAEEVERSLRYNRAFSLCFLDLDGFKQFNDTQGHLRGDQALRETAALMRKLVRASADTCYRYGGDELTLLLPETVKSSAHVMAERVRTELSKHFQGRITASIGIAQFCPPMKPEELIEKADRAMYVAKSQGGNRVVLAD